MNSPDYAPSEPLTPVKGAYSPDCAPSELATPMNRIGSLESHYPTPPDSKPKVKIPPGNLQVNTHIALPVEMREKGPQRTIIKWEGTWSAQGRRALNADGKIMADAHSTTQVATDSKQPELDDYVRIWTTHVDSVSQPEFVVAMNPFYDEWVDGDYYVWLNDTYYEGHMPEIVRRANAFRGFPQLDDKHTNPQGWEQKHAYYRSEEGIREMEPYQPVIERQKVLSALLDPRAEEEATREGIEAFQKTWGYTLGLVDEPTSATLRESSEEPSTPSPTTKPKGSKRHRIKSAPMVKGVVKHTAGSSNKAAKKRKKKKKVKRTRHGHDKAYKPGRDASGDESDDDLPQRKRKRNNKSKM